MYSKADTHMHTTYSDGFMSPQETIDIIVAETDLQVIAITDHDTAEGAFVAQDYAQRYAPKLEVIVGQEVTTEEGDILGLFVKSTLPQYETALEAITAIHAQGGLAIAAHPFSYWSSFRQMHGVGTKICELPFDAVEVCNGFPTNYLSNSYTAWINRNRGQKLPELGGSDSHVAYTIGQPFTWFPGETAQDFREAVETGAVRSGGTMWAWRNVARLLPIISQNGLPQQQIPHAERLASRSELLAKD